MTALPQRSGVLRTLAVAAFLLAASACGESPSEPASEPTSQPLATTVPGAALAADYAAAVAMLPDDRTMYCDLGLDARGVAVETEVNDRSVAEIVATLETLQGPIETIIALGNREDRFPPCSDSSTDRDARMACRLLASDAVRLFSLGQEEESAQRLAACLGIVRQLSASDEVCALAGVMSFDLTRQRTLAMINGVSGRRMGPEARSIVLRSFDRLDRNAPFGPFETTQSEQFMSRYRSLQSALNR